MLAQADKPFRVKDPERSAKDFIRTFLPRMLQCEFRDLFVTPTATRGSYLMRSLAILIAGGPARVAITTIGIVRDRLRRLRIRDALLAGLFATTVFASASLLIGLSLCFWRPPWGSTSRARSPSRAKKGDRRDAADLARVRAENRRGGSPRRRTPRPRRAGPGRGVAAIADDDDAHSPVWARVLLLVSWHAAHGPD